MCGPLIADAFCFKIRLFEPYCLFSIASISCTQKRTLLQVLDSCTINWRGKLDSLEEIRMKVAMEYRFNLKLTDLEGKIDQVSITRNVTSLKSVVENVLNDSRMMKNIAIENMELKDRLKTFIETTTIKLEFLEMVELIEKYRKYTRVEYTLTFR